MERPVTIHQRAATPSRNAANALGSPAGARTPLKSALKRPVLTAAGDASAGFPLSPQRDASAPVAVGSRPETIKSPRVLRRPERPETPSGSEQDYENLPLSTVLSPAKHGSLASSSNNGGSVNDSNSSVGPMSFKSPPQQQHQNAGFSSPQPSASKIDKHKSFRAAFTGIKSPDLPPPRPSPAAQPSAVPAATRSNASSSASAAAPAGRLPGRIVPLPASAASSFITALPQAEEHEATIFSSSSAAAGRGIGAAAGGASTVESSDSSTLTSAPSGIGSMWNLPLSSAEATASPPLLSPPAITNRPPSKQQQQQQQQQQQAEQQSQAVTSPSQGPVVSPRQGLASPSVPRLPIAAAQQLPLPKVASDSAPPSFPSPAPGAVAARRRPAAPVAAAVEPSHNNNSGDNRRRHRLDDEDAGSVSSSVAYGTVLGSARSSRAKARWQRALTAIRFAHGLHGTSSGGSNSARRNSFGSSITDQEFPSRNNNLHGRAAATAEIVGMATAAAMAVALGLGTQLDIGAADTPRHSLLVPQSQSSGDSVSHSDDAAVGGRGRGAQRANERSESRGCSRSRSRRQQSASADSANNSHDMRSPSRDRRQQQRDKAVIVVSPSRQSEQMQEQGLDEKISPVRRDLHTRGRGSVRALTASFEARSASVAGDEEEEEEEEEEDGAESASGDAARQPLASPTTAAVGTTSSGDATPSSSAAAAAASFLSSLPSPRRLAAFKSGAFGTSDITLDSSSRSLDVLDVAAAAAAGASGTGGIFGTPSTKLRAIVSAALAGKTGGGVGASGGGHHHGSTLPPLARGQTAGSRGAAYGDAVREGLRLYGSGNAPPPAASAASASAAVEQATGVTDDGFDPDEDDADPSHSDPANGVAASAAAAAGTGLASPDLRRRGATSAAALSPAAAAAAGRSSSAVKAKRRTSPEPSPSAAVSSPPGVVNGASTDASAAGVVFASPVRMRSPLPLPHSSLPSSTSTGGGGGSEEALIPVSTPAKRRPSPSAAAAGGGAGGNQPPPSPPPPPGPPAATESAISALPRPLRPSHSGNEDCYDFAIVVKALSSSASPDQVAALARAKAAADALAAAAQQQAALLNGSAVPSAAAAAGIDAPRDLEHGLPLVDSSSTATGGGMVSPPRPVSSAASAMGSSTPRHRSTQRRSEREQPSDRHQHQRSASAESGASSAADGDTDAADEARQRRRRRRRDSLSKGRPSLTSAVVTVGATAAAVGQAVGKVLRRTASTLTHITGSSSGGGSSRRRGKGDPNSHHSSSNEAAHASSHRYHDDSASSSDSDDMSNSSDDDDEEDNGRRRGGSRRRRQQQRTPSAAARGTSSSASGNAHDDDYDDSDEDHSDVSDAELHHDTKRRQSQHSSSSTMRTDSPTRAAVAHGRKAASAAARRVTFSGLPPGSPLPVLHRHQSSPSATSDAEEVADASTAIVPSTSSSSSGGGHKASTCAEILHALRCAGLQAKRVRSLSRRTWLIKLRAPEWRLEIEAEKIKLRLRRIDGGWSKFRRTARHLFAPIHPSLAGDDAEGGYTLFHSSDRQTLIHHILQSGSREGGADLGVGSPLGAYVTLMFPLHTMARLDELRSDWLALWRPPRSVPEADRIGPIDPAWYADAVLVDIERMMAGKGASSSSYDVSSSCSGEKSSTTPSLAPVPVACPPFLAHMRGSVGGLWRYAAVMCGVADDDTTAAIAAATKTGLPGASAPQMLQQSVTRAGDAATGREKSGGSGSGGGGKDQPSAHYVTHAEKEGQAAPSSSSSSCSPARGCWSVASALSACGRGTGRFCGGLLSQPLDRIAAYFGEHVAFYFAWLEFYTRWLLIPAAAGVLLFLAQLYHGSLDIAYAPLFSLVMALWSMAFLEMWKRRNAELAQRWGVLAYEAEEVTRPQFQGQWKLDTRTGEVLRVYPRWRRAAKYAVTVPVVLLLILCMLALMMVVFSTRDHVLAQFARHRQAVQEHASALAGIAQGVANGTFSPALAANLTAALPAVPPAVDLGQSIDAALSGGLGGFLSGQVAALGGGSGKDYMSTKAAADDGGSFNLADAARIFSREEWQRKLTALTQYFSDRGDWQWWLAMVLPPVFFGLMMPAFEWGFASIAKWFNDWENHATESRHRNHLIAKIFCFRFVASFISLFYYAFSPQHSLLQLSVQLATFMIVGQVYRQMLETCLPRATAAVRECRFAVRVRQAEDSGVTEGKRGRRLVRHATSQAWREARLPRYDTFNDYAELLIQFGYVTFFSWAFPLAPLCALINNLIEMRTDAYKLCYATQRPIASKSGGIGVWYNVLVFMALLAVLTNSAHLALTSRQFASYFPAMTDSERMLMVFLVEHAVLGLRLLLPWAVPELPRPVRNRLIRDAVSAARLTAASRSDKGGTGNSKEAAAVPLHTTSSSSSSSVVAQPGVTVAVRAQTPGPRLAPAIV